MTLPKKLGGRQKTVSFRLPEDLMEQMRALAKENRRTLSGEVQIAIEKHLRPAAPPRPNLDGAADGTDGHPSMNDGR